MTLLTELEFMPSSNYRYVAPAGAFHERQGMGVFHGTWNHLRWLGSPAGPGAFQNWDARSGISTRE